ncbi:MAG TPA: potassium channel family protein [Sphingomicrobium sp.]
MGHAMLIQLGLATLMVTGIALIHLVGLAALTRVLRSHSRLLRKLRFMPLTLLMTATIGIIGIHTIEIWIYAGLYMELGAFRDFEEALYFSTVTYASIGYGDLLMARQWRILGAIEGAAGIFMIGWSTAYVVSILTQLKLLSHDWLTRDQAD